VRRIREDAALHDALQSHIERAASELRHVPPAGVHAKLRELVNLDMAAGRLTLSPEEPTPFGWRIRNVLHLLGVPLMLLLLSPLLLVAAIVFAFRLRQLEKTDPELCARHDPALGAELALIEDHDVSNQFSAMGSLKPGFVRLWTTRFVLLAIDYAARHVYTRGRLARVRTIHFARWTFLDGTKRILFASNYDGSLESYMNDFIDKAAWGLNAIFSNGDGFPRTSFLFCGGIRDEKAYKRFLPTRQVQSRVWFSAYPHLTTKNIANNAEIRLGLSGSLTPEATKTWLMRFGAGNRLPESGLIARILDRVPWDRLCRCSR
jgi:hypothetical protein